MRTVTRLRDVEKKSGLGVKIEFLLANNEVRLNGEH